MENKHLYVLITSDTNEIICCDYNKLQILKFINQNHNKTIEYEILDFTKKINIDKFCNNPNYNKFTLNEVNGILFTNYELDYYENLFEKYYYSIKDALSGIILAAEILPVSDFESTILKEGFNILTLNVKSYEEFKNNIMSMQCKYLITSAYDILKLIKGKNELDNQYNYKLYKED